MSGATYIEQLALPRSVDDSARAHGGVIEISIESANFPNQLYKPSALDGFCAGTRFRPDLTTKHHGESAPANPGTHPPRPELVSSPVDLAALNKTGDEDITVRYIPYYLATGTP